MGDYSIARKTADAISNPVWWAVALVDIAHVEAAAGDAPSPEWCWYTRAPTQYAEPFGGDIKGIAECAAAKDEESK